MVFINIIAGIGIVVTLVSLGVWLYFEFFNCTCRKNDDE